MRTAKDYIKECVEVVTGAKATDEHIDELLSEGGEGATFYRLIAKAINDARKEAIKECAESADVDYELGNPYDPESKYYFVDKKSILKLIDTLQ